MPAPGRQVAAQMGTPSVPRIPAARLLQGGRRGVIPGAGRHRDAPWFKFGKRPLSRVARQP